MKDDKNVKDVSRRSFLRNAGVAGVAVAAITTIAIAPTLAADATQGELFLYNWSDYTAPDLIEKFESETAIKVVLDTYDSNETLLAKLKQGATGYDIVVPSHNFVQIFIKEGLLQKINASEISGYENIDKRWQSPSWDAGNAYTIPWQWGTTSYAVDTAVYDGNIDSYGVLFTPPPELDGKIGMFKTPEEVIPMAQIYLGIPLCSEKPSDMQAVYELLSVQKPAVKVYNSDGIKERLVSGDVAAHMTWNGYSLRSRKEKASIAYAYPTEGVLSWFDNIAVPKGAKNKANAIKFIEFMLQPENAAIQSNFAGYANGIAGSPEYMNAELKSAPEVNMPANAKSVFTQSCSEAAIKLADRAWTKLLK